jgi:hypothetical protein
VKKNKKRRRSGPGLFCPIILDDDYLAVHRPWQSGKVVPRSRSCNFVGVRGTTR